MQVALRATQLSTLVLRAPLRIGYDRARSKDLHGMFINRRIVPSAAVNKLDAMGQFHRTTGIRQNTVRWDIPVLAQAEDLAARQLPGSEPTLLVSPAPVRRAQLAA